MTPRIGGMPDRGICSGCQRVHSVRLDGTVVTGRHSGCSGAGLPPTVLLPERPLPPARVVRRPRTVLSTIRAAELAGRVPWQQRLDPQPCEIVEEAGP